MSDESPWAKSEKDQRQADRTSRIEARKKFEAAENPVVLGRFVSALEQLAPHLGVGIAGGLCAEKITGNVERLLHLFRRHLSVDAEGAIPDGAADGGDLVHDKAKRFVFRVRDVINADPSPADPSA